MSATTALKAIKHPNALVNVIEHRLTSDPSPIVSLAMTLPAGNKFSAGEEDCGQISAAYKHALLQVIPTFTIRDTIAPVFDVSFLFFFRALRRKVKYPWLVKRIYVHPQFHPF